MIRIKLQFAFGQIRKTEDLLETRVVDDTGSPVELRNGVFVTRSGPNRFEFHYENEAVTVDLNLSPKEEYEASYHLGFHAITKEYFSVIHSGEGDGWDIHRPCMASVLIFQGRVYLIDAGPNLLNSLTALGIGVDEIEGVFHTHAHDDHFNGLTVLLRSDHRIQYYATALVRHSVQKKLSALTGMKDEDFSRYFEVHDLEFDRWNDVDGLEVKPVFSPHPVETSVLFFRALGENGYKTYAHMADISSFDVLKHMSDAGPHSIPAAAVEKTVETYLSAVDLKKIDAGGGMIHGNPGDFREDKSKRLILSHSSHAFSDEQREIGSTASFGTVDVLIPATQDYAMQAAYGYFKTLFPGCRDSDIRLLLNCPVAEINPGSILIKKGEKNRSLFVVLNGVLEFILSENDIRTWLSAGSLAGELSGVAKRPSTGTYRAESHVRVLEIPCALYIEFLKRTGHYEENLALIDLRRFLQTTWLFGELHSCPAKSRLARRMTCQTLANKAELDCGPDSMLYLVAQGELELYHGTRMVEAIGKGGFFGEEPILTGRAGLFSARARGDCRLYQITPADIADIPIVQWKLVETFERRKQAAASGSLRSPEN